MIEQIRAASLNQLSVLERLERGQYTFDVDAKVTKSEAKCWIEGFLGIRVIKLNSHRLTNNGRNTSQNIQTVRHKRMIVTVPSIESIPALSQTYKRTLLVRKGHNDIKHSRYRARN